MKRKIFIRSLAIAFFSVIIVFVSSVVISYVNGKNIVNERLVAETKMASSLLDSSDDYSSLQIFYNNDECRVTIMSTNGDVLYDSDTSAQLGNHADREEVRSALAGTPGTVERYSETFKCNMTYYALLTTLDNGEEVVVRLAIKGSEVTSYVLPSIPFLVIALVVATVLAGIFTRKLSSGIAKQISDISQSLKSVNGGTYEPIKPIMNDSEFFSVYNEINELNAKTLSHIKREEREREKLNAVLDGVSQGIVATTDDHKIVFVNGSALKLFGGKDTVVSKDLVFLIDNNALLDKITTAYDDNFEIEFENKILRVEIRKPTGKMLEGKIGRILIFSDVTKEKELARQKEEFFANASHELKTPLTTMMGLAEIMIARGGDESTRRHLERIYAESVRLSGLISDMLKLSWLDGKIDEDTSGEVNLEDTAKEVVAELATQLAEKNVTATVSGTGRVKADGKKMFELIQNLCSNAVNYNKPNGTIDIKITEGDKSVVLSVKDSGIGIEKEHLPRLCERFYRVDKSRSKKTGGTGLGLAIVKHICALYNAELSIQSEIGVGTQVTVKFNKA